jgi:hypothetical protein
VRRQKAVVRERCRERGRKAWSEGKEEAGGRREEGEA